MLLLCKQKIVFPLPSVSGKRDAALRSLSVLLINGIFRQPGWSLSYLVPATTTSRYFPLAFVVYFLSPPLIFIHPVFFLSASQSDEVTRTCTGAQKVWSHFPGFSPTFSAPPPTNACCCRKALGRTLRISHGCHMGLTLRLSDFHADRSVAGECGRVWHSFLEMNTSMTALGCTCSQDVSLPSLQALFGGPVLPESRNGPCPSLCSP